MTSEINRDTFARIWRWAPMVLAAGAVFFSLVYNRTVITDWMMDDAFISFRYAEHWAQGHGPVYNPGETPVEGYTNFLWMALLALGARLGGDIVVLARLLGAIAGVLTLLLLYHAKAFMGRVDRTTSVLAVLFLASFCIFQPWPTSGMETTFFGLLTTFSLLLHFHTLKGQSGRHTLMGLGLALALTAMTRPEGLLVAGLVLADQALESLRRRSGQVAYVLACFSLVFLPWFFWRWSYYGAPLPNTFYAKVGATAGQVRRGRAYFWDMFAVARPLIIPATLAVLLPWVGFRHHKRHFLLPLLLVLYAGYVILVGGDGLPAFRFFAPLAAPLCLLAAIGVRRIVPFPPIIVVVSVVIIGLNGYQLFTNFETYQHVRHGDYVQKKGALVGKWLRDRAPAGTVLATNTAGTIPYYSGLNTIDMLGLNNREIARRDTPHMGYGYAGHEKGDGAYVLSQEPDLIQFSSASGSERPSTLFIGDNEIWTMPAFREQYELAEYEMEDGTPLIVYVRKDAAFMRDDAPVVFEDFESGAYDNWTIEGTAFGEAPTQGTLPDQKRVQGYQGRYLMNSKHGGIKSTGRAVSKPFIIRHNYINFLLGGGHHPGETGVHLVVDGERVKTALPLHGYELAPELWDVSDYLDREAVIEVVDESTFLLGFIMVDRIVFTNDNYSVDTVAREYMHARFGLLPWLLLGAGLWCVAALRRRQPLSLSAKLLPVVLLLFFIVLFRTAWVCDDSYITMRTVDNFVNGRGLTWNVMERVQAYTHPLWMLAVSSVYYFSGDAFLTLIVISMVFSMAALCVAAWGVARTPQSALAGLLVLMFTRAFTDFSVCGLENPLTHLLLALFVVIYLRRQWTPATLGLLTLVASGLVLNRMDLSLMVAPAVGYVWLSMRTKKATAAVLLGGMPVAAWMLFSLVYYGFPFPNTAYAKLGGGFPRSAMIRQSYFYYMHTLTKDPATLVLIVLGVAAPLFTRNGRHGALSLGIALYLVYIVRIGGDFMGHRFFAAPLFLAVLILMRFSGSLPRIQLVPATTALILLSLCAPHAPPMTGADFGAEWEHPISRYGICNERQFYFHSAGLLHWRPGVLMPTNNWAKGIVKYAMLDKPLLRMHAMIGFQGYFSGPKTVIVDPVALSDPLLARLPAALDILRIGHLRRNIPEGYPETLATGENRIEDADLAVFYDKLCLITRGPLFSRERWRAIFVMNTGGFDHLIDDAHYRLNFSAHSSFF